MRTSVKFSSGGIECDAWLYLPRSAERGPRVPIIVMAHGLGGIKAMGLDVYAERFQAAGYGCLVFDYRYFGESAGEPRALLDISRQRADWHAAIAYARSLPGIDPERVVAWGTSFAGGHVIATAAKDVRLAAAIAQCPFTDGPASIAVMPPWTGLRLTLRGLRDFVSSLVGVRPVLVPLIGKKGQTALMTSVDSVAGFNAIASAANVTPPSEVSARIVLQLPFDRPGALAGRIACPILFCVCDGDTVAPSPQTLKHASRAPKSEVKLYSYGHFEIYLGAPFEHAIKDQIAFLQKHVPSNV